MTLLRIDTSVRRQGSVSRELADVFADAWPEEEIVRRDLTACPDLHATWQDAVAAGFLPEEQRTPAMRAAKAAATELADEALAAREIAVAAPLYNFGAPATLKSWIDLLITDPRFDPRHTPQGQALAGVPVTLLIARGGGYRPGTPREGWDHATPYLRRIFGDLFGAEVTVIAAELTAVEFDPSMAALRPQAAASRAEARSTAATVAAQHAARRGRERVLVEPSGNRR
ncbi:FMN-dependent NADH-azoreductase [Actinoalloteichus hoggarensis]|uniref:FMN dependent NADH:quinone oxidoreductase n=1 Tax=Actinoalloteichus hoggarensis TaxID=1470176 RepID=A0A221W4J4_9PSEU|nr:NAD(P)H-dependent oxidoreductase [Actinoalloteichus hoggarensis]ASO20775.1 FMN-dependent NADH-azoreductase 1 [Actinoalloteichus hoggarensis]MBB5920705.1 FMN-dependent NADH-azoreductase [Actinoalloteichus hoggarensis]